MWIEGEAEKFYEIFQPRYSESLRKLTDEQSRFVYYTNAETALKIIRNKEIWFRNAAVMNDFSEISYGLSLTKRVFASDAGAQFWSVVTTIFHSQEIIDKVCNMLDEWEADWRLETFLFCVSLHDQTEDKRGRLSMWRAYGDAALVFKRNASWDSSNQLGVYMMPVNYFMEAELLNQLSKVTSAIEKNSEYIRSLGEQKISEWIWFMVFLNAIGTKHPGFSEEKECRFYFRPTEINETVLKSDHVVIKGIPQEIWKFPLHDEPQNGLNNFDIPSILDRIIIGPTRYPYVTLRTYQAELIKAGVKDVENRIVLSDIPLRTNS